ncbi:hypothetical protein BDF20DRAFT_573826 [Mycotypha africana]|uniref:uncharacterized protein n=1 Tax=Mycotypha africana TaxID=64632 RepID=UPI002301DFA0|nr:uncharacterized protein BDF20DRAFT_573826 [Mycotypha africana]KAI8977546.1 hypothetical protein BDF20DRAFT_573826 [Mycotypha africana]
MENNPSSNSASPRDRSIPKSREEQDSSAQRTDTIDRTLSSASSTSKQAEPEVKRRGRGRFKAPPSSSSIQSSTQSERPLSPPKQPALQSKTTAESREQQQQQQQQDTARETQTQPNRTHASTTMTAEPEVKRRGRGRFKAPSTLPSQSETSKDSMQHSQHDNSPHTDQKSLKETVRISLFPKKKKVTLQRLTDSGYFILGCY